MERAFENVIIDPRHVLGPDGLMAQNMPGYEYRPQQVEAAAAISDALSTRNHCIVEAGTGVGKSMAYLIPAFSHALSGKKVIISTFTLYLQSQLINKDIPFLQNVLACRGVNAVLMKGRGNYLCLNSFDAELGQLSLSGDASLGQMQRWLLETDTGDVAELDFSFSGWSDVCCDVDSCHYQECRYFSKCFYYKARKAAAEADIVITNHSLYFSDLAIRAADPKLSLLPDYDVVIFDEAHHLENVVTKVFGVECSSFRIPSLLNKIKRTKGIGIQSQRIQALEDLNADLFASFARSPKQEFFFSDIYKQERQDDVEETVSTLCTVLDALNHDIAEQDADGRPELKERLENLKRMCGRLKEDLEILFFGPLDGYFKWGDKSTSGKFTSCFLRHSPLSVANILQDLLWKQIDSVVLTSATLTNSGTFKYMKARLGMPGSIESIEDSPFDYQKQCVLYIPRHLEFPSESPLYADKVADEIEGIVHASNGRAFLLFTSYRMMNAVYDRLAGRLPYVMMRQGDMSNEALVEEFLRQQNACLFGVHSFWEGVDIRGEALSCVVIDKLPFAVPDNPVQKARVDSITAEGGDWFREYSMPQAQMKLKQGFGRLIRTKKDSGVVAILDSRLVKKTYGREFLRFLPQCPVTHKIEDVQAFFATAKTR